MSDASCSRLMDFKEVIRDRFPKFILRLDGFLLRSGRRLAALFREYRILIAVMLIGFIVWSVVFNIALVDYLNSSWWNSRTAWLGPFPGPGEFNFFGYTIEYQLEGYSDYSFYYVHWGYNVLNGVLPYSPDFGYLDMGGIINQNGAHMFPPLTSYFYAAGIWLGNIIGPGNWGIGLLLASCGYLTALPVYGIAKEFSKNPRVGEIAALTYLLNPLVLYHIDYIWLNPSAFYFFFFAGFYFLVKDRRHIGTILIVTAALFKQTAWFLGIPLVVYLLLRKRKYPPADSEELIESGILVEKSEDQKDRSTLSFILHYFDLRSFAVSVVVAASYAGAIMLPTLIAQPDFWNYWKLALGHFEFENFTDLPKYGVPETLPVLLIRAGMSGPAEILNTILISGGPLVFGVIVCFGVMVLLDKMEGDEHIFMRRLLFITMVLILWVNLTGPRGVFKYYFTLLAPFLSIFASAQMIRGKQKSKDEDHVPVSFSMFFMPFVFTLLILIPDRNVYLLYVTGIFFLYLLAPLFDRLYDLIKRPFRWLKQLASQRVKVRIEPMAVSDTVSQTRVMRLLEYVILIFSTLTGVIIFAYGVYICYPQLTAPIPLILRYFMVAGVLLMIGVQMLSIGFNGLSSLKEKHPYWADPFQIFFATISAVTLIYGGVTYGLSWNIDLFFERQILVISSTLMVIWALSLIVKLKGYLRFLTAILLLTGASLATWTWVLLSDPVMYTVGYACISGLILYVLLLLRELLQSRLEVNSQENIDAENIEVIAY